MAKRLASTPAMRDYSRFLEKLYRTARNSASGAQVTLEIAHQCLYQPPSIRRRRSSPSWKAALAQLVEHIIRNDGVTCSSHVSGTILPNKSIKSNLLPPQYFASLASPSLRGWSSKNHVGRPLSSTQRSSIRIGRVTSAFSCACGIKAARCG